MIQRGAFALQDVRIVCKRWNSLSTEAGKGEHDIKIGKVQEGTGSIHRMDRESVPQSETKQWKTRGMSTGNNKEFVR